MFYYVYRDHYSKFTKVTVFLLLVLIPAVIFVFVGGAIKMLDFIDPIPELVSIP
jgi:hypothetical protein